MKSLRLTAEQDAQFFWKEPKNQHKYPTLYKNYSRLITLKWHKKVAEYKKGEIK